jgi:hypothetical protein
LTASALLGAEDLPRPLACYQKSARAENIESYMSCFADGAVMIDMGRTFTGKAEIKRWAQREVIPNGSTFKVLAILDRSPGYYKTFVQWMSWRVHYHFWYDHKGKITKMSLQYAEAGSTDRKEVYSRLPEAAKLYFDAVKAKSSGMLEEAFLDSAYIVVVSRKFSGNRQIKRFAETEVYGGRYELLKILVLSKERVKIHLRFTPKGWNSPEPDAVYDIFFKDGRIEHMDLQYAR